MTTDLQQQPTERVNGEAIMVLEGLLVKFEKDATMQRIALNVAKQIELAQAGEIGFCSVCGDEIPGEVIFKKPLSTELTCGGDECLKLPV